MGDRDRGGSVRRPRREEYGMSPRSKGWRTLHNDPNPERHALLGGDWKVKARMQPGADDRLWLNIQLPDRTWTYIVLEPTGDIAHQERGRTKRECWERTAAALRDA
jgi:hypothetical protein